MTRLTRILTVLVIGFLIGGIVVRIIGPRDTTEAETAVVPPTFNANWAPRPTSPVQAAPAPTIVPPAQAPASTSTQPPPATPAIQSAEGLVAYYPFDGNAHDASGNNAHGIAVGPKLVPDRFGNSNSAYSFDGFNDYFVAQSDKFSDLDAQSTISMWIKMPKDAKGRILRLASVQEIMSVDSSFYVIALLDQGDMSWEFHGPNGGGSGSTRVELADGNWHHLVAGPRQLFLDGQFIEGNGAGETELGDFEFFSLGAWGDRYLEPDHPRITIDEVRIYNRALSADEIKSVFEWSSAGVATPAPTATPSADFDNWYRKWESFGRGETEVFPVTAGTWEYCALLLGRGSKRVDPRMSKKVGLRVSLYTWDGLWVSKDSGHGISGSLGCTPFTGEPGRFRIKVFAQDDVSWAVMVRPSSPSPEPRPVELLPWKQVWGALPPEAVDADGVTFASHKSGLTEFFTVTSPEWSFCWELYEVQEEVLGPNPYFRISASLENEVKVGEWTIDKQEFKAGAKGCIQVHARQAGRFFLYPIMRLPGLGWRINIPGARPAG